MAGVGPPPKPGRRRRNATIAMTPLPAAGRPGPPPPWPLPDDVHLAARLHVAQAAVERLTDELESCEAHKRDAVQDKLDKASADVAIYGYLLAHQHECELAVWAELWTTPHAVQWERLGWTREVAQYTRWKVHAESGDLPAAKEARQLADRLGLNPLALLRLRWAVDDPPDASSSTMPLPETADDLAAFYGGT